MIITILWAIISSSLYYNNTSALKIGITKLFDEAHRLGGFHDRGLGMLEQE
jgi:hypothetical protein